MRILEKLKQVLSAIEIMLVGSILIFVITQLSGV